MKKNFLAFITLLLISVAMPQPILAKGSHDSSSEKSHVNIKMQAFDSNKAPVKGTKFWVTLEIAHQGSEVDVFIPQIGFQVGQSGGYLFSKKNAIPKRHRPKKTVLFNVASNNGMMQAFSYNLPPTTIIPPPVNYTVKMTSRGHLKIYGPQDQLIPSGQNNLMPCTVSYKSRPKGKVKAPSQQNDVTLTLQQTDSYGYFLPGTAQSSTLSLEKSGDIVTVNIPEMTFTVTGDCSPENPSCPVFIPGSFLNTTESSNFIPEEYLTQSLIPVSKVVSSQTGSYIVGITHGGELEIQAAGTNGNILPVGNHIIPATKIKYHHKKLPTLKRNVSLSTGQSNVSVFPYNFSIRDSHVCDVHDGLAVWAWNDNSMQADQEDGVMNLIVAVADIDHRGKIKNIRRSQLTNFDGGNLSSLFDTAVSIVKHGPHKGNIVVSYSLITSTGIPPYVAVSKDRGETWVFNGPMTIQPPGNPSISGDNPGVKSDKFGNVWYLATNLYDDLGNFINQPYFSVSTDGGVTYSLVYTLPFPADFVLGESSFDFPQMTFGGKGDGSDEYGIWFKVDYINPNGSSDFVLITGFIPLYGPNDFGTPSFVELSGYPNTQDIGIITASKDGKVWLKGIDAFIGTTIAPSTLYFKSPGPLDANYAGQFEVAMCNTAEEFGNQNTLSFPQFGYFNTLQDIIYDDKRQALYALDTTQVPYYSQDMQISFLISRNNGLTWTKAVAVNTTNFANRGFASMALDQKTGNLIFGFYDGRNDPNFLKIEYMGAVLPARQLDKMVDNIPLSNPLFEVPAPTEPLAEGV